MMTFPGGSRFVGSLVLAVSLLAGCAYGQDPVPAAPAIQHQTLHVDGVDYPLAYFVPDAAKTSPVPVVLLLHGHGGTGDRALIRLEMADLAAKKGFIVLAPTARETRWRDFGDADEQADFDLFAQLLDMVPGLGGDPKRVYIAGFSNGGNMAMVVGGRFADRIAAIASGGSTIGRLGDTLEYAEIPKPKQPIPILLIHGMEDSVISYDMSTFSISTPDCLVWWARQDGLAGPPKHEELAGGDILRDTYEGPDGMQAMMLSYRKLGHDWPNVVDKDTGINFDEELWKFLSRFSLRR